MLDQTITNALLDLRARTIRDGSEGLAHVVALLILRGVDLATQHVRRKIPQDSCAQSEVKLFILAALRDGPKTPAQIGAHFMAAKPWIAPNRAMIRVYRAIYKARDKGVVRRDGRVWRLAQ